MKLNHLIETKHPPFGIYCYNKWHEAIYSPNDMQKWFDDGAIKHNIKYARTSAHLQEFLDLCYDADDGTKESLTNDGKLVKCVHKQGNTIIEIAYFWVNSTGDLTTWQNVLRYYRLTVDAV